MKEVKSEIIKVLKENPGSRLRMIASLVSGDKFDLVLPALFELAEEGFVYSIPYQDFANMENYNMWYATEEANENGK